jgi:hypothetical protein
MKWYVKLNSTLRIATDKTCLMDFTFVKDKTTLTFIQIKLKNTEGDHCYTHKDDSWGFMEIFLCAARKFDAKIKYIKQRANYQKWIADREREFINNGVFKEELI